MTNAKSEKISNEINSAVSKICAENGVEYSVTDDSFDSESMTLGFSIVMPTTK
ncbi:MAG: hypothetical protein KAS32_20765 [Candidatus Peribacteraceae bacterium]|nr:hypothetical protein [Candidatus Peribacteraceae bacterium]